MNSQNLDVDIQLGNMEDGYPTKKEFQNWVACTLDCALNSTSDSSPSNHQQTIELTIRLVDEEEGEKLNQTYRGSSGATNVLSFPFENLEHIPDELNLSLLGDIVICVPVVKQEARAQNKKDINHWAHLTVHGTLHLLGYDHINDKDARIMENLETRILNTLGFPDPYIFEPSKTTSTDF